MIARSTLHPLTHRVRLSPNAKTGRSLYRDRDAFVSFADLLICSEEGRVLDVLDNHLPITALDPSFEHGA